MVYAAGTKIIYRNNVHFPDRLEIEGPTDKVLRIVVSGLVVTVSYCNDHTSKRMFQKHGNIKHDGCTLTRQRSTMSSRIKISRYLCPFCSQRENLDNDRCDF